MDALLRGLNGDLVAIEELMLQEVLRQSLEQVSGPPSPVHYNPSAVDNDDDDDTDGHDGAPFTGARVGACAACSVCPLSHMCLTS